MGSLRAVRAGWHEIDCFLLLQCFLFAAAVPVTSRVRLDRLQRFLDRIPTRNGLDSARVRQIVRCVTLALDRGRPLIRRTCLTRGLTLYYFLRRAGLGVELCFGAGYLNGEFAAHCWLERNGELFLEPADPRASLAEMYRLPRGTSPTSGVARASGLPR